MNFKAILAITAAVAVASSASAQSFKKAYDGYLVKLPKAMTSGDVKFFDWLYTSDFTEKTHRGTHSKAEELADMRDQFSKLRGLTCKVKSLSLKVNGSKAATVTQMHLKAGAKMPDGKFHTVELLVTENEFWVKVGSSWKQNHVVDGEEKLLSLDGHTAPGT